MQVRGTSIPIQVCVMHADIFVMTDIEALLSVDAGRVPEGTVAFFTRDPEIGQRRLCAVTSGLLALGAVASGLAGAGLVCVAMLALGAGVFAVLATPTISGEQGPIKKQVVVVTPSGIIMRDAQGLRNWTFEDLTDSSSWVHADRVDLLLVRRDGTRIFIDCHGFDRGDKLPDVISRYRRAHATS
jgi:hypothetical protein